MDIKQKKEESLWAYMSCFNMTILEACDLYQLVAMTTLRGGLQKNDLLFSLEKRYPKDFTDQVEKYAWAKETFKMHGTSIDAMIEKKKEDQKLSPIWEDPPGSRQWSRTLF